MPTLQPYIDRASVKAKYKVDHIVRILPQIEIQDVCYWYSLWSHRRDGLWKGYADVDLAPVEESQAASILAAKISVGFQP